MHEPPGYDCPFCRLAHGVETERNRLDDIVWRDEATMAFVAPKWWPRNHGHVIVVPLDHVENIYAIDDALLGDVYASAKRIALALKEAYACDGTSMRQHNEPAGYQDVWHLHVHVFPRWENDDLYVLHEEQHWTTPEERAPYAERLRRCLTPVASDTR